MVDPEGLWKAVISPPKMDLKQNIFLYKHNSARQKRNFIYFLPGLAVRFISYAWGWQNGRH